MKKENEQLQKVNADETKNVSGGYLTRGNKKNKFDVHDNKTGKLILSNLNLDDAMRLDRQYNAQELIEQKASEITDTGRYYTRPMITGLKKRK